MGDDRKDDRKRVVMTHDAAAVLETVADNNQLTLLKTAEMAAILLADHFDIDIEEPKHWDNLRGIIDRFAPTQ